MAGQSQAAHAEAQAASLNADAINAQATTEAARLQRMNRVELARQRASIAQSGVQLEGSTLEQIVRNANELEQNVSNVMLGAKRDAMLEHLRGRNALGAGRTQMLATLLAGASSGYGAYSQSSLLRTGSPAPATSNYSAGGWATL